MEIVQHFGKLMMLLGTCSLIYEILSKEVKPRINEWLSKNLNTQKFLSGSVMLLLSVGTIHLFTNFAGYITPYLALILLFIPFLVLGFVVYVYSNSLPLLLVLQVPIAIVSAGLVWFLSWITPHSLLEHSFLPYSLFSSLAATVDISIVQWLVPPLTFENFQMEFDRVNAIMKSLFSFVYENENVPWVLKVINPRYWWTNIYFDNTNFSLLICIVCTQVVYFFGLFMMARLIILAWLYPLFQTADAVKKKTGVKSEHAPVMGIILLVCGAIIDYVTFVTSD